MSSIGRGPSADAYVRRSANRKLQRIPNLPKLEYINDRFARNLGEIKNLFNIKGYDESVMDDIHRSQLVFLYSSLDNYMHEIIAYGLVMIFYDYWKPTQAFMSRKVSLSDAKIVSTFQDTKRAECVEKVKAMLVSAVKYDTMMQFDTIVDALEEIGICPDDMRNSISEETQDSLKEACRRRNRIVHQSDRRNPNAYSRDSLDEASVKKEITLVENLQTQIHSLITEHDKEMTAT